MVEIRPAASHAELHACVDLQEKVWGIQPRDVVPFHQLLVAHTWGGQVIVAVEDGEVTGFSYGFAGRQYGRPALLSHMLGVVPSCRGRDLGAGLKLAQGRWALENGYDLVTWTFDPLEAVNANLNLGRLGGVARRYLINHYGEMPDRINRGLPTDRLLVEWHLRRPAAAAALRGEAPPHPEPPHPKPPHIENPRRCFIPMNFQQLKETDPEAALGWRLRVRDELVGALNEGYTITGFKIDGGGGAYRLTRESFDVAGVI